MSHVKKATLSRKYIKFRYYFAIYDCMFDFLMSYEIEYRVVQLDSPTSLVKFEFNSTLLELSLIALNLTSLQVEL